MANELLNIGKSGLGSAQRKLSTTSHNIANANTEGYTRQRAEAQARSPLKKGSINVGQGVDVKQVRRIHDQLIEKKVLSSQSHHQYHSERAHQLGQTEEIFNEINGEGMNKLLNNFFNNFRELANRPDDETVRSIVRDNARVVVNDFKRISGTLNEITNNINQKIIGAAEEINALTQTIATLNTQIADFEVTSGEASDLRDQRDLAISSLSEFMNVTTYEDEKSQYVVNIEGVGTIVTGGTNVEIGATHLKKDDQNPNDPGSVHLYFASRPGQIFSDKVQSGKLQALIQSRDGEVEHMKKQMDLMAYQLSSATNAIHRKGYINAMVDTNEQGEVINNGQFKKLTGIDFFRKLDSVEHASEKIDLSDLIKEDAAYIASALEPNSPGDNRVALAITKLQNEKFLNDGTSTLQEQYLKAIGSLGTETSKSKMLEEQSKGILAQNKSIKERISGVSLDEEAANMIRYQHQYQAAAKVIGASEDMFNAVMNLKR